MAIKIRSLANADEAFVVWNAEKIPGCLGFALQRRQIEMNGRRRTAYVKNRMGFEDEPARPGENRPSDEWPFQRYSWLDYEVHNGDRVQYRVIPVYENPEGTNVRLDTDSASDWTSEITLSAAGGDFQFYFNRSFMMSDFVGTSVKGDLSKHSLNRLAQPITHEFRRLLHGQLGDKLLELLHEAQNHKDYHVYAALFKLADGEILDKLASLEDRAHIVLANGDTHRKGRDDNREARKKLRRTGAEINDRMLWYKGLGHNSFMVISHGEGDPQLAWTGSLDWTTPGLCTQLNSGILIQNPEIAQKYLEQWRRLKEAGSDFTEELIAANDQPKQGSDWTLWFTRTSDQRDLDHCRKLIRQAGDAIFFLMCEPGPEGLQNEVMGRKSQLHIQGVINSINQSHDRDKHCKNVNVQMMHANEHHHFNLGVVQPVGLHQDDLGWWSREIIRRFFVTSPSQAFGFALLHSNIVVIDPFGESPAVMAGSHNLGISGTQKNDENLMIIEGNQELAKKCAVHILSVYDHFQERAFLLREGRLQNELRRDDRWQNISLAARQDIAFWMRQKQQKVRWAGQVTS